MNEQHAGVQEVRELAAQLIGNIGKDSRDSDDLYTEITANDLANLENVAMNILKNDVTDSAAFLKMIMYLYAKKLKSDFYKESTSEAKSRNEFFEFTVYPNFVKNEFPKNNLIENSGQCETIYWFKKGGRKKDGETKFFFKMVAQDPEKGYTRNCFHGKKWQIDLVMKYEKAFAEIRKMNKYLTELKRQKNYMVAALEVFAKKISTPNGFDKKSLKPIVDSSIFDLDGGLNDE